MEREALKSLVLATLREHLAGPVQREQAVEPAPLGLVTEQDVLAARSEGRAVYMTPRAIVTPLARETAERYGVALDVSSGAAAPLRCTEAVAAVVAPAPAACVTPPAAREDTVALASDHGGFALKQLLARFLADEARCRVLDLGTHSAESVDYPDFAHKLAATVARGEARFGICIDGMGLGSAMVANRHKGVRAATCREVLEVVNAREHNDANVLCLGGRVLGDLQAKALVSVFLATPFAGGRHAARVAKIESGAC